MIFNDIQYVLITWIKAAMDAVNVDLDEMRARVDSTHSIITSRQRVEEGSVDPELVPVSRVRRIGE